MSTILLHKRQQQQQQLLPVSRTTQAEDCTLPMGVRAATAALLVQLRCVQGCSSTRDTTTLYICSPSECHCCIQGTRGGGFGLMVGGWVGWWVWFLS
jgi:hypothetical protein